MSVPHPFALERYFARHEFSARYLLGSSDPEALTVADLFALDPEQAAGFPRLGLGYTECAGDPELRRQIARLYETVAEDRVLVFSGAEEPIYAFFQVVLDPGDHVIVHTPAYASHLEVPRSLGADVEPWAADPARNWALDPEDLRRRIRTDTKVILVSFPHNPTGFLPDPDTWREILKIAQDCGAWLLSDEVYRGLEHDPSHRLPAACDRYERAVSLSALSKTCGLAGLRLGWVATHDRDLLKRLATFKDYLTICNAAPSEFLGRLALEHAEHLFGLHRARLKANLEHLAAFFQRQVSHFAWERPRAGTTTLPRLRQGNALAFCDRLVEATGVMLVPSGFFGMDDDHLRFGYGRANLAEALARLEAWLEG